MPTSTTEKTTTTTTTVYLCDECGAKLFHVDFKPKRAGYFVHICGVCEMTVELNRIYPYTQETVTTNKEK